MDSTILGDGWFNVVFMPPISCDRIIPDNSVGKIGRYEDLKREYDFIIEYVKYSPTFSALVNDRNTFMCKFKYDGLSENTKRIINSKVDESANLEYKLIMPYLGKTFDKYINLHKNNCNIKTNNSEIISVDTFVKYVTAINQLFQEILLLNDNGIYHNDIKPNNIIYNEHENSLLLIDFNISITKNIPQFYVHNVKFYQELKDIYNLIELVLMKVLLLGLSNKYIYDKFIQIYTDIKKYILFTISPILRLSVEVTSVDISNVKNQLIEFMNNIMLLIREMDTLRTIEENTNINYCNLELKMPFHKQREYAATYSRNKQNQKIENQSMFLEDKKGGKKNRKTRKFKNNKMKNNKHKSKSKKLKKRNNRSAITTG